MSDDPYAAVTPAPSLTVHSDDFEHGGEMPLRFRDPKIGGQNLSPHLSWSGFPDETQSFAVTCYDPAPTVLGFNLHFHTLARGSVTAWVDAQP